MATFGAGFISDLLKSAHQTGVQDTSVKEIKDIVSQLRNITNTMEEKTEFLSTDLDLLNENLNLLMKMRDDINKSSDKDTHVLRNITERLEITIAELQNIIHEVAAKGSFKPVEKDEEDTDKKIDSIFPFLHSIPLISSTIVKSINVAREAILNKMNKIWVDMSTKIGLISSKLGVLSKDIAVNNALNSNMLKDLKNYNVKEQQGARERDLRFSSMHDFVKKWQDPENNPIARLNKRISNMFSFITRMREFLSLALQAVRVVMTAIWTGVRTLIISFFTTVLPMILLIAAIVALTIIVLYLVWKHFGEYIKKFWGYIKEYVVDFLVTVWNIAKEILGFVWDTIKTVWGILVDIYDFVDAIFSGDFTGAWKIINRLMSRIVDFILSTFQRLLNIGTLLTEWFLRQPLVKWFMNVFMVAWKFYTELFDSMWEWVKGFWTTLWSGLKETVSGVISNIGDALNPFNWFASGGEVSKPVKGVVGEAGPEAIIPLSGGGESKLSKALIEFFDYYLPFLKPTIDFLWNSFKPFMPILESVMESIYNVVYGIVSGLSNLPGWLGGNIFKTLLGKMNKPGIRATGRPESQEEKNSLFAKILKIDPEDIAKSRLAIIGPNQTEIQSLFTDIQAQAESVERASRVTPVADTTSLIKQGFVEINKKIDQAVGNLAGTIAANANKAPIVDPAYELSKMLSRGQLGGKI